jgi:Icc-related predicted phosphoesterase
MKIVALSDLHIGKWNDYGINLLDKAGKIGGDVLWLNGDIIEPTVGVNEFEIFDKISDIGKYFNNVVWVAGNNCLELNCLSGPVINYAIEFGDILSKYNIHLLDRGSLNLGDYCLIGSIGWSNGALWSPSVLGGEHSNSVDSNQISAEKEFRRIFGRRWNRSSAEFFKRVNSDALHYDISVAIGSNRKIILGTHFVTSREFCIYGESSKYDYLNWYMGFNGSRLYDFASPILAMVGHTHRPGVVNIGKTIVQNISGVKEPSVFLV